MGNALAAIDPLREVDDSPRGRVHPVKSALLDSMRYREGGETQKERERESEQEQRAREREIYTYRERDRERRGRQR